MAGTGATVWDRALRLLAVRDHGRVELGRKLSRNGAPAADVEGVLDRLAAAGYLNDRALVGHEVERLARDGRGPLAVRQKLRARGFDSADIESAISLADDADRFRAGCRGALRQRFRSVDLSDRKAWLKAARFLAGRGFPESLVRATLRGAGEDEE